MNIKKIALGVGTALSIAGAPGCDIDKKSQSYSVQVETSKGITHILYATGGRGILCTEGMSHIPRVKTVDTTEGSPSQIKDGFFFGEGAHVRLGIPAGNTAVLFHQWDENTPAQFDMDIPHDKESLETLKYILQYTLQYVLEKIVMDIPLNEINHPVVLKISTTPKNGSIEEVGDQEASLILSNYVLTGRCELPTSPNSRQPYIKIDTTKSL